MGLWETYIVPIILQIYIQILPQWLTTGLNALEK